MAFISIRFYRGWEFDENPIDSGTFEVTLCPAPSEKIFRPGKDTPPTLKSFSRRKLRPPLHRVAEAVRRLQRVGLQHAVLTMRLTPTHRFDIFTAQEKQVLTFQAFFH
jgi:hypothetical protein